MRMGSVREFCRVSKGVFGGEGSHRKKKFAGPVS